MNCSKAQMLISELADGELSEKQAVEIHQHLDECKDCRHSFEVILQLKSAVKAVESPQLSPSFNQKLFNRLHGDIKSNYVLWPLAASILMVALLVNDFSFEDRATVFPESTTSIPSTAITDTPNIESDDFNACANSAPENECSIEPKYHLTEFVGV